MTPASETFCFCPPEREKGVWAVNRSIPTMPSARRTFSSMTGRGTQSFSSEKATSSPTVSPANWQSESCMTVPTRLLSLWMSRLRVSSPMTLRLPVNSALTEKGSSPFRQEPSVDFPLPGRPEDEHLFPLVDGQVDVVKGGLLL